MSAGSPRQRGVTRADVAKLAGVSTAVVSYTLNGGPKPVSATTRERVLDAVRMLDYRPNAAARALSSGRSDMLALVIPTVEQPYFAHLAAAVESAAREAGMSLIVANALPPRVAPIVRELIGHQLRGIVLASEATTEATKEFLGAGIPTVLINQASPTGSLLALGPDFRKGAVEAVRHLVDEHGHQHIAYVGAVAEEDERVAGWRGALRQAGRSDAVALDVPFSFAGGRAAARTLRESHPEVTAVFCASDQLGIGLLSGLDEAGRRAPDDLAIVAFDGSPEAEFSVPPLTTIAVPLQQMAQDAVHLLLEGASQGQRRYDPTLVVRRSCGCP